MYTECLTLSLVHSKHPTNISYYFAYIFTVLVTLTSHNINSSFLNRVENSLPSFYITSVILPPRTVSLIFSAM